MTGFAWRERVAEARRRLSSSAWPATQASIAAALAWLIAHDLLGHAQPFFAPIAAAIALSTSNIQRSRRSVQMVGGVFLGIGAGEAVAAVAGTGTVAIGLVVLVTMATALILGVGFLGEGMMFVNQAAASAILVVALHHHGTGPERLLDALVGGAVALVIGVGLFPAEPLRLMRSAERGVLNSLAVSLTRASELLRGQRPAGPEWMLAAAQDIHLQLAALTRARATALTIVKIAPRRRRLREAVHREQRRGAQVDLLANATLSLLRAAVTALHEGEPIPARLRASLEQLAGALAQLARTPQPWPADQVAPLASQIAQTIDARGPHSPPLAPTIAWLIRETGRDLLLILPAAET